MGSQLKKIESELDLVNAVLRGIYNNSEKTPVSTTDLCATIKSRYDISNEEIESMLTILSKKYGLVDKHVQITTTPKGAIVSEVIRWSLRFDTRG